jgi:hypothetical protein
MTEVEQKYTAARERLRTAEEAYRSAESELIGARREVRDTERAYIAERFPDRKALEDHFR